MSSSDSIRPPPLSSSQGDRTAPSGRATPSLIDAHTNRNESRSRIATTNSSSSSINSSTSMNRPSPIAKRPSAELLPVPTYTNWTVLNQNVRRVPSFYPLEKSSRFVPDQPSHVASRISDACRLMSVQANYDDQLATADLVTGEHVEIHLTLWRGDDDDTVHTDGEAQGDGEGGEHPNQSQARKERVVTIVEAQRRKGCAVVYHRYCRNLLDAAQGCFEVKHDNSYAQPQQPKLLHQKVEIDKKTDQSSSDQGSDEEKNEESALYALEIAASLLKKDRMDARRLGMESLCLLTDPNQTGMENAILASQVVLFGSVQDHAADAKEGIDFIPDELGIREAILSLVQFGKIREYCDYDSASSDDEEDHDGDAALEAEFNDILHNLALLVLANALEVLEVHGHLIATGAAAMPDSNSKPSANKFLEESKEISKRELLATLLSTLGRAASKPHDACLSAQCLKSLFQGSKEAKRRAKDLNAKQIVMTALDVGRRTHVKLETETENVIQELEKPDTHDDDEGSNGNGDGRGTEDSDEE